MQGTALHSTDVWQPCMPDLVKGLPRISRGPAVQGVIARFRVDIVGEGAQRVGASAGICTIGQVAGVPSAVHVTLKYGPIVGAPHGIVVPGVPTSTPHMSCSYV